MELHRPRVFGNCWLACALWGQLGLEEFWQEKFREETKREWVPWEKVLRLLVVNRLIDPGSEFRIHRQWFEQSAMGELLETDFAVAEKDRLYRCLDRLRAHKQGLFIYLRQRWQDLFHAQFDVLLYDLTSTYIEGEGEEIPKARYGYSRDRRFDCLQVVIALVITPEGFPLAYEVMDGNTSDRTTLRGFVEKIEARYGRARRVWVMDRGIPTEDVLAEMRAPQREVFYLVGTPRSKIRQYEKKWLDLPWRKVRESVEVKLFADEGSCWPKARVGGPKRPPCGASGWLACSGNCVPCAGVVRRATNSCCGWEPRERRPAALTASCASGCRRRVRRSRVRASPSRWIRTS